MASQKAIKYLLDKIEKNTGTDRPSLWQLEREYIRYMFDKFSHLTVAELAERMGVPERSMYRKLQNYDL